MRSRRTCLRGLHIRSGCGFLRFLRRLLISRHRVVTRRREGGIVVYSLAHPGVAQLLSIARTFRRDTLTAARVQLEATVDLDEIDDALNVKTGL